MISTKYSSDDRARVKRIGNPALARVPPLARPPSSILTSEPTPLFERYHVQTQNRPTPFTFRSAPVGGYIAIDEPEALIAID